MKFISQSGFVPARYILAILGSVGMAIVYGLKVNLSVAMVIMVNNTALKIDSLTNQVTTCNDSLANLRQSLPQHSTLTNQTSSFLNQTTLLESIANKSAICTEMTTNLADLLHGAKTSEVSIHQNINQKFKGNRNENRLKKLSKPF